MKQNTLKILPLLLLAALLTVSCATGAKAVPAPDAKTTATQAAPLVYKGKITGRSHKAKSISIMVGDQTQMVKFDDQTRGLEFAVKGEAAIIQYERRHNDIFATTIKPKLAKLPAGVTEMQPEELAALLARKPGRGEYDLIDARPSTRYQEGHIPTAVSIPVAKLAATKAAMLPQDKDTLLIFYCGGPT